MRISRRHFIVGTSGSVLAGTAAIGYAAGIAPFSMVVARYQLELKDWAEKPMRLGVIADPHACYPYMTPARLSYVVAAMNAQKPDIALLLGDYEASHRFVKGRVPPRVWANAFGKLEAQLGVHAVMGNHDWWDDPVAQARGQGPTLGERALRAAGIAVYENRARQLRFGTQPFWLAGLGDQLALPRSNGKTGMDDLPATLAQITDDAPAILMAHEPDIFPNVPARVGLTLSGHTHGGQARVLGVSPKVPSAYGNRYAYGLIAERDSAGQSRNLLVSGGLGCSVLPIRFGVPPEIVVLDISAPT